MDSIDPISEKLGALGASVQALQGQIDRLDRSIGEKLEEVRQLWHQRAEAMQKTILQQHIDITEERSQINALITAQQKRVDDLEKLVSELRGARKLLSVLGVVVGFAAGLIGPLWFKHS